MTFAEIEGIDRLATDPYWMDRPVEPAAFVHDHAAPLIALARETGREAEIWIQGIRVPAGQEASIDHAVAAARALAPDLISFWSFRATDRMSSLACGDPEAAWAAMMRAAGTRR